MCGLLEDKCLSPSRPIRNPSFNPANQFPNGDISEIVLDFSTSHRRTLPFFLSIFHQKKSLTPLGPSPIGWSRVARTHWDRVLAGMFAPQSERQPLFLNLFKNKPSSNGPDRELSRRHVFER